MQQRDRSIGREHGEKKIQKRINRALWTLLVPLVCMFLVGSSYSIAGAISGTISYTGTPAKPRTIDMSKDPVCANQHLTPQASQVVVTGGNNTLENVVVYVSSGAPDENQIPSQVLTYDQKGCIYIPHILAMHTDQEFKVLNSDETVHNVHAIAKVNEEWNKSQTPGAAPIVAKYSKPEFISVKCNIHPWMHGYFVVLKTNHFDISRGGGRYKLPDLPPGKYTITAWQEDYGTENADVTITGNETKEVNFSFKAKAY